jgi:hypothetical protein
VQRVRTGLVERSQRNVGEEVVNLRVCTIINVTYLGYLPRRLVGT